MSSAAAPCRPHPPGAQLLWGGGPAAGARQRGRLHRPALPRPQRRGAGQRRSAGRAGRVYHAGGELCYEQALAGSAWLGCLTAQRESRWQLRSGSGRAALRHGRGPAVPCRSVHTGPVDHWPPTGRPSLPALPYSQHVDLSNCCLTRVPAALARLPHLTSLTLNENDALGGSADALAPLSALSALEVLEMRECGLTAVPASVAGLTRLRSLLLGYNAMTEVRGGWQAGGGSDCGSSAVPAAGAEPLLTHLPACRLACAPACAAPRAAARALPGGSACAGHERCAGVPGRHPVGGAGGAAGGRARPAGAAHQPLPGPAAVPRGCATLCWRLPAVLGAGWLLCGAALGIAACGAAHAASAGRAGAGAVHSTRSVRERPQPA